MNCDQWLIMGRDLTIGLNYQCFLGPGKCETYFTMNLVPDNLRTELASMNLVGKADNWYYGFQLEHGTRPWLNFVGALYQRFEDRSVSGFCGQFKNMYQTGTVKE